MDDATLEALLKQQETQWQKMSEELMQNYVAQYQAMSEKAMSDMQKMIVDAKTQTEAATNPEIHMQWMQVEGQNVLVMSEKAGKEMLGAFDILAKLLPQLDKLIKQKRIK